MSAFGSLPLRRWVEVHLGMYGSPSVQQELRASPLVPPLLPYVVARVTRPPEHLVTVTEGLDARSVVFVRKAMYRVRTVCMRQHSYHDQIVINSEDAKTWDGASVGRHQNPYKSKRTHAQRGCGRGRCVGALPKPPTMS